MKIRSVICLTAALWASGCAYVTSVPVTDENPNPQGFVQYEVMPILVVSGGQPSIKYIPDFNKKRVVQFGAFLAKNDLILTLRDNGTIETVDAKLDATAPVDGLFQIANRLLDSSIPEAPAASGAVNSGGDVRIFAFQFDDAGNLIGLRELSHIPMGAVATPAAVGPLQPQRGPDVTNPTDQS